MTASSMFDKKISNFYPWRIMFSSRRLHRLIITGLALVAIVPPVFFHFRLRLLYQENVRKCGWLHHPPLVCAHGGDSSKSFPNTMDAYQLALDSGVNCIEIDASRSSDGVLFALHDRDLQQITGNRSSKVGYISAKEIKELSDPQHHQKVPTLEDALTMVSRSVQQVIVDVKVGPPFYEHGLARDIFSVIVKSGFTNCLIWSKSDELVKEIISRRRRLRLPGIEAGYIMMWDPHNGRRTKLLRIDGADSIGVYHRLIDDRLVTLAHGQRKRVYAWTVEDAGSMRNMMFRRVDGVVTGNPGLLHRVMEDIRTDCNRHGAFL